MRAHESSDSLGPVFVASLLFALHPIHTEAVSSVVGRAETLSASFFCVAYLIYSQQVLKETQSLWWSVGIQLGVVVPLAVVSMLCKEGGVTVIGTCVVLDVCRTWQQQSRKSDSVKDTTTSTINTNPGNTNTNNTTVRTFLRTTTFALSLLFLIYARATWLTVTNFSPTFSFVDNYIHYAPNVATRARTYAYLHYLYVKQLIYPFNLSCDWSYKAFPLLETWTDVRLVLPLSMYITTFMICVHGWSSKKYQYILATLGLGIIPFVPSSNVFFPVATVLGERLLYLPSMGFVLLVSIVLHRLTKRNVMLRCSVVLLICVVYGTKTYRRNQEWSTALKLFKSAVQVVPTSCKAQVCVAAALNDIGTETSRTEALVYIEKAFDIKQDYAGAHFMKGNILRELNQLDQAAVSFQKTIQYSSTLEYKPDVLYLGLVNLGALLMHGTLTNVSHFGPSLHQTKQAKHAFEEALVLEPNRYAPNANLAEVLSILIGAGQKGVQWDDAVTYYDIASKHEKVQGDLYNNYAIAVYKRAVFQKPKAYGMDVLDEVLQLYHSAIAIDPNYVNPRRNAGKIYYRQKKYQIAAVQFSHCVELMPTDGRCWYDLALCQMRSKQWEKARDSFQSLFEGKTDRTGVNMVQAKGNYDNLKQQIGSLFT